MAQTAEGELVDRFEQFYRNYYREEIGELAGKYPSEQRSLHVDWGDLYQFDADLADDYISKPEEFREYAEEALRLYDLPVDVSLGQAHVRVHDLPEVTDIREIRSPDVNTLVAVQGIVRKATDVRPKIEEAAFECQRCGTLSYIPQSGGFQEPHECQGCERQGPFSINYDQSTFVDAQKLRVQERPEGLRGGETPQSIDVDLEDDLTGEVAPGDYVTVTGVLRIEQQSSNSEKTRMFDVYMDGHSLVMEDEAFEEMDISEEEKQTIIEISQSDDVYDQMVESIAPSIYGFEEEKLAIAMQLFSGVTKHLPDESRIRGDLHILLIGDPGTGKCVDKKTEVTLSDGRKRRIGDLVESRLDDPVSIDDGVYQEVDFGVQSLEGNGSISVRRVSKVWKREAPPEMLRIRTASGHEIEATPSHPFFVQRGGAPTPIRANDLSDGTFIAVPQQIRTDPEDTLDIELRGGEERGFSPPDRLSHPLARLFGYIIGEGHIQVNKSSTVVTNADHEVIEDVLNCLESLGLDGSVHDHSTKPHVNRVLCSSSSFVDFLEEIEPAILKTSEHQRVPNPILRASTPIKREFLRAYVEGEGHVSTKEREITVASMSRELLEGVRSLLLALGIRAQLAQRQNGSYRLRISGTNFAKYVETVGFVTERKSEASEAFEETPENTNTDVVPGLSDELREIRETLELSQSDCNVPRTTYQHYERGDRNPSRQNLRTVVETFEERVSWLRERRERIEAGDWSDIERIRRELDVSQQALAEGMDVTQTAISYYERGGAAPDGGRTADAKEIVLDRIEDCLSVSERVGALRELVDGDVSWDRIESIETVDPDYDWVYDLEVEGTHNYISNGIVSHNSQLLQYIQHIAPRSVYTSGKGSSAAGLTAAAVQSDFGEGQAWTLEAGALVLADKGTAAVDELDKMAPDDRSAMHEALEQQEISISKAGITATLKSRCALLGAANPKYGRFDEYEPIAEQIELDPALISRFDLIFTVTDQPDEEEDRRLAEHIIQSNYAGELSAQHEKLSSPTANADEAAEAARNVEPTIDAELLRKYVAYAKRDVFPTMTDAARERIRDFYVEMRSHGTGEDAPVPITARKLEALVRLAEASARVRLSDTVEEEDAERVIEIVQSSLRDVGMDPETGEYDADIVETEMSKSQRDRVKNLKTLIQEIEDEYEEGAPVEEVIDRAEELGMDESKADHEIEKLKQKGELYEPMQGYLRTT
ncbi:MAG: LAGLIDADG family homing endonuclease [Halobacteriales archaeon]